MRIESLPIDLSMDKAPVVRTSMTMCNKNLVAVWNNKEYRDYLVDFLKWTPVVKSNPGVLPKLKGVLNTIVDNGMRDADGYKLLRSVSTADTPKGSGQRSIKKARQVLKIHNIGMKSRKRIESFLDFGCGDGSITEAFASITKVSRSNAFGVDVKPLPSKRKRRFTFIKLDDRGLYKGVLGTKVDLVYALMVFHHVEDTRRALVQIKDVLKPGGSVIFFEHSVESPLRKSFLDVVHGFYSLVLRGKQEMTPEMFCKDKTYYRSIDEWKEIVHDTGYQIDYISKPQFSQQKFQVRMSPCRKGLERVRMSPCRKGLEKVRMSPRSRDLEKVRTFYDKKTIKARSSPDTLSSKISKLRSFNNWIKRMLITNYCQRGSCVLDMCCGKGGDIFKYSSVGAGKVMGFDISKASIHEAISRSKNVNFTSIFRQADCFSEDISQHLRGTMFDFASCQLALHYAFSNEFSARTLLKNTSSNLKDGSVFVVTTTNANAIISKLRSIDGYKFGNSIYKISFDKLDKDDIPDYGARYTFTLTGAIDAIPEYLVMESVLVNLASEYGLQLELSESFDTFYRRSIKDRSARREFKKRVGNADKALSKDEWEVISLMSIYVFKKVSQG